MRLTALQSVVLLATLVACVSKTETAADTTTPAAAAPAVDVASVRQTIEANNARAAEGLKKGDMVAAMANYAEDAIVMMPSMPAFQGRAAIEKGFTDMASAITMTDPTFTTQDVIVNGDIAVETGAYSMTLTPKGGTAFADKGKYLTVWKRQPDGSWKVVRDINNSDAPPKM
jgi:uncharacterized protein (TIGR02246 family)